MPVVPTRLEFLVVRHVREAGKPSNTARLAAAAMPRCQILDYGAPGRPFDDTPLRRDAWLLFPPELDGNGVETGRHPIVTERSTPLPEAIVVLDGTWGQARRMSHRIPALASMPRVALPAPAPDPGPPAAGNDARRDAHDRSDGPSRRTLRGAHARSASARPPWRVRAPVADRAGFERAEWAEWASDVTG